MSHIGETGDGKDDDPWVVQPRRRDGVPDGLGALHTPDEHQSGQRECQKRMNSVSWFAVYSQRSSPYSAASTKGVIVQKLKGARCARGVRLG